MKMETSNRKIVRRSPSAVSRRREWRAITLWSLVGLLSVAASARSQEVVRLMKEDVQRGTVSASSVGSPAGAPTLQVESAAMAVKLPSGKTYPSYLITAFDPSTGLFWWTIQGASSADPQDRLDHLPANLKFFVSDREIVGIELGTAPVALWILRSDTRVDSLETGRAAAVVQVAKSARGIEQGTARWMRVVSLVHALPYEFYYSPNYAMPKLEMEVTSVERSGSDWLVTLKGREGRVAEVRLDDLFVLESARELEPEPGD